MQLQLLALFVAAASFIVETRAAPAVSAREQLRFNDGWALEDHLGNLSPWRKAPVPEGISEDLPENCVVDQVMLMHRHGSRYPLVTELLFIQGLSSRLANASDIIQNLSDLPDEFQFLKKSYSTKLGHDDLTAPGRRQTFDAGVEFRLQYPQLAAKTILAGLQDRVVESAQWFQQGFFGRTYSNTSVLETIPEDNVTISWITPMNTCPLWQYNYGNNLTIAWGNTYLPPIQERLNDVLQGVELSLDDVHGAFYACVYDLAAWGVSPWCSVFTHSEIEDFEYELDLLMVGAFGYNLPGDMGSVLGSLLVDKVIERFTNASGTSVPMYLEFGHDTSIDMALTALGLAQDDPPLTVDSRPSERKWRTSQQVPFAARMVFERFSCSSSSEFEANTPYVRLMLNASPFPLSTCQDMDSKYGTCTLADFTASNKASTDTVWGDARWNQTCGNPGF
ncbi:hypothetical protein BOTBODRAFT_29486 [Botryobasidium botryosum FD-172 SS1]|uniref:Phosphoglycerate mutase-like protein n=1 Tax=Botryobasidium botryosum (strain FD-172 SS1) TaxID=930990 RepID=A0A067MRC6_BOTB1|nr:hypothetical protein BOTBODRAFT_29486 [Botryobasidium botryosum FD-172 SS1]